MLHVVKKDYHHGDQFEGKGWITINNQPFNSYSADGGSFRALFYPTIGTLIASKKKGQGAASC